jgi:hypothetical protein
MRYIRYLLLAGLLTGLSQAATFQTYRADAKSWTAILGSIGITGDSNRDPEIIVAGSDAPTTLLAQTQTKILILEGAGPLATQLGITAKSQTVSVRQIVDTHAPNMHIIWEQPVDVPQVDLSADFTVFAKEKWKGAPVLAGKRTARGAVLWLAASPGTTGIERFPYLLLALTDLGWTPSAEATDLWAFFDSSYRIRADPDYLARRWRQAGIGVLHVAAWHNMDPDSTQDDYLKQVIEACHRHAISVYAWLELPHVSEKFWADHPAWREKTAVGQDAQLDWRKLMNLQNGECRRAISQQITNLLARFDWDGVNLAELYFESLESASNPARFTPMNDDVRTDFQRAAGFDPKFLFIAGSPYAAAAHPEALRKFLDYRADLAVRMQREWLGVVDQSRISKPYLDVVLTHIDDRFDTGIRDELGADVARSLPLIQARKSTLLIEDPAPLWALGPERYARLADKYKQLASDRSNLAVDINVVERYQDVYPTKKQTGVELLELVHQAAQSFGRVAIYFENSLEKQDLSLLPAAATAARVEAHGPDQLQTDASEPTRVAWQGPVEIDGKTWPIQDSRFVLTPGGKHLLSAAFDKPAVTLQDFNGDIHSAFTSRDRVDVSYNSRTRAIAILASATSRIEIDGQPYNQPSGRDTPILLPSGQHIVTFHR